MFTVVLVDDEVYARQGLRQFTDWNKHGFDMGEAIALFGSMVCGPAPYWVPSRMNVPYCTGCPFGP